MSLATGGRRGPGGRQHCIGTDIPSVFFPAAAPDRRVLDGGSVGVAAGDRPIIASSRPTDDVATVPATAAIRSRAFFVGTGAPKKVSLRRVAVGEPYGSRVGAQSASRTGLDRGSTPSTPWPPRRLAEHLPRPRRCPWSGTARAAHAADRATPRAECFVGPSSSRGARHR